MIWIDAVFVPSFQFYRPVTNISCYIIVWAGIHPDTPLPPFPRGVSVDLLPTFR